MPVYTYVLPRAHKREEDNSVIKRDVVVTKNKMHVILTLFTCIHTMGISSLGAEETELGVGPTDGEKCKSPEESKYM